MNYSLLSKMCRVAGIISIAIVSLHSLATGSRAMGDKPSAGETITFSFPMREETTHATIGRRDYTLTFRGNTVVDL
jgi:hypothetical protein